MGCHAFRFMQELCSPIIEKTRRSYRLNFEGRNLSDWGCTRTDYLRKVFTKKQNIFLTANLDEHQICYKPFLKKFKDTEKFITDVIIENEGEELKKPKTGIDVLCRYQKMLKS